MVRYALVDLNFIRQSTTVTDDELEKAYKENIQQFQVPNRVHVQHILLNTVGQPDASVDEIKKKAEDILAQAKKKGSNFEELAKKYSEDPGSKTKGGDIGWIVQGQTVPEFEKTAFSLNKGDISDLVKTQYGFHIIKVLDKESAHTKTLDEVKEQIRPTLLLQKADQQATELSDKIAGDIRQSGKITLDEVGQKYHLPIAETRPVGPSDSVLEFGNSRDAKDEILRLRQGEVSLPLKTDRGYVVLSLQQTLPAHAGTLDEVRDKVIVALKQQKADQLAHTKATELEAMLKAGEKFDPGGKIAGSRSKSERTVRTKRCSTGCRQRKAAWRGVFVEGGAVCAANESRLELGGVPGDGKNRGQSRGFRETKEIHHRYAASREANAGLRRLPDGSGRALEEGWNGEDHARQTGHIRRLRPT